MKRTILVVIVLVLVIIGAFFLIKKAQAPQSTPTPVSSAGPITPRVNYYTNLPGIASCNLKGTIRYVAPNIYNNGDALFSYAGVDDAARNIFWDISPKDSLSVGPNIFDKLPLPEGSSLLTIGLPSHPIAKRYTLTASMQYGRLIDGNIKVSTTACTGSTTVILP